MVIGTLMTEGGAGARRWARTRPWSARLGAMPLFHPDGAGGLVEDWD